MLGMCFFHRINNTYLKTFFKGLWNKLQNNWAYHLQKYAFFCISESCSPLT